MRIIKLVIFFFFFGIWSSSKFPSVLPPHPNFKGSVYFFFFAVTSYKTSSFASLSAQTQTKWLIPHMHVHTAV